jgi:hypothetical protein
MFVKFNPTLGTSTAQLRAYNFMRVVTAVCTAAGGSTPVVNPLTAANTYNTGINLITEVIANTEAGGWNIADPGEVVGSGHNLPDASYNDTGITGRTYRADFWRDSGKIGQPFVKFTVLPQVQDTWTSYPYLDIIYGTHVDKRFSQTAGYQPSGGSGGGTANTARNLTAPRNDATGWAAHQIRPNETGTNQGTAFINDQEWFLASTADYVILIHPKFGITYLGTRAVQPWEQIYSDNPPIFGFHCPVTRWYGTPYANIAAVPRKMMAWWRLLDGDGNVRANPFLSFYEDLTVISRHPHSGYDYQNDSNPSGGRFARNCVSVNNQWVQWTGSDASAITRIMGSPFGEPLFKLKGLQDSYTQIQVASNPWMVPVTGPTGIQVTEGNQGPVGITYPPMVDPNTGILVPPAYPIVPQLMITSNTVAQVFINQGGALAGIYKSLSGADVFMERYYNPGQNFTIGGSSWYPVVTGTDTAFRDMFLIRRA